MNYPIVERLEKILTKTAPYMASTVSRGKETFGESWENGLENILEVLFDNDEQSLQESIKGYIMLSLDSIRLQKLFERDRCYQKKNYSSLLDEFYSNENYMNSVYLPANLLIHYLWPHQYRQLLYFQENFLPEILNYPGENSFCDVGTGTGFYSLQILRINEKITGTGFDVSEFSLKYALKNITAFTLNSRWTAIKKDIIHDPPSQKWPVIISIEILEHLEDPLQFLRILRHMLSDGGKAFISAAITAPQRDHIFLYNGIDEIMSHLYQAGFEILDFRDFPGYPRQRNKPVPRIGSCIVQ